MLWKPIQWYEMRGMKMNTHAKERQRIRDKGEGEYKYLRSVGV